MALTIEQVIGANVAHLRRESGMTQVELGRALEPFTGSTWSHSNLSLAEKGRRGWSANDVLSVAMVFQVPVWALFTPRPDQAGDLHTAGQAVVTQAEWITRTAAPSAAAPADAEQVNREVERVTEAARKAIANILFVRPTREDGPDGPEETAL